MNAKRASLSIDFLVVGGGIAGLACAVALRRVGHRVVVLEKYNENDQISGGIRMPPNGSKILFHWGLREDLMKIALKSESVQVILYETGEIMGTDPWNEEILRETGGEFIFVHHADLRRLLANVARSLGAEIRYRAEVVSVDTENCQIKLSTGEKLRADVIIGADGPSGLLQKMIAGDEFHDSTPCNFSVYNTTVPGKMMRADPELARFVNTEHATVHCWFGHGRGAAGFPVGAKDEFALHVFVPKLDSKDKDEGSWGVPSPIEELRKLMIPCESSLRKISRLATVAARVQLKDIPPLEEWVHDNGRMVLIGEAAHPIPAGAIQAGALAVEDAAVLAKLFSHLKSEDQITSFLYAFQELREPRCALVIASEMANLNYQTLSEGELQQQRDAGWRAKLQAGQSTLEDREGGMAEKWEMLKDLWGYDAEDDADNWWVQWGVLRERAKQVSMSDDLMVKMNDLQVRVE